MKVKRVNIGIRNTDDVLQETAETMKAVAAGKRVRPKGHRLFSQALRRYDGFSLPKG